MKDCLKRILHTIDCNGNALMECIAISANKGRDLAELVDLEIFGGDSLGGLSLDDFQLKVVCFGHSKNCC